MRWLSSWIRNELINAHPLILASVFGLLRNHTPFVRLGKTVIVLRQDDIRDVLSRPADFELGAVAEHKMLMGPFLLGLDPWRFYTAAKFEDSRAGQPPRARPGARCREQHKCSQRHRTARAASRMSIPSFAAEPLSRCPRAASPRSIQTIA